MNRKLNLFVFFIATIVTMFLGIMVIVGWFIHNNFLREIFAGQVRMKFNVAVCFILSSLVLMLRFFAPVNKTANKISTFISVIVSLTGLLTLIEYVSGINIGIDEFFVKDELPTTAVYYAGRMSPLSALNFLLIGIGLLLQNKEKTASCQFYYLCGIAFTALLMLIGFNFTADIPTYFRLAIHVAIGFITLPAAIWFSQPELQKKISFERKLFTGFTAIIFLILALSVFSSYYSDKRISTSRLVKNANSILSEAVQTLSLTKDIESGGRGYIITGDSNFLEYFTIARNTIFGHIENLKKLTAGNASQQALIDSLSLVITKRIEFSLKYIQLKNDKGLEAAQAMIVTRIGKSYTDRIRKITSVIQQEENSLLIQRQNENNKSIVSFNRAFTVFLGLVFILLSIILFSIRNNFAFRRKAEKQSRESEEQIQTIFKAAPDAVIVIDDEGKIVKWNSMSEVLFGWKAGEVLGKSLTETIIPPRYHEAHLRGMKRFLETGERRVLGKTIEIQAINKNNTEFEIALGISPTTVKSKQLFIGFIRDITERKKAERELKAANKELEAFSYSVSHDLRAPIRIIDGYSKMLAEAYSEMLDKEGNRILGIISTSAERMGYLIDGLLNFIRMGRKELAMHHVNMTRLVNFVIAEQELSNANHVKIYIGELESASCDNNLIQQVWSNYISNAIKYSRQRQEPVIEINSSKTAQEIIYKIKDNGVGFDMVYAGKLFGVFQRLHNMQEIEGTGIGLALVQRIVIKHGGRVWAEAEIDKGATFYFSLPVI